MKKNPVISNTLLRGVVGSQAYGMSHDGSDVDYLGIFAHSTYALTALHPPRLTYDDHDPDIVLHEAGKYCKLALSCNPTVLDLMWLDEYEVESELGHELIALRQNFLSATRVKDAYLGYARQQFKRITMRGDNSFSSDTRKRTAKHARHLMRLCETGLQLWSTGEMQLKVADPEGLRAFGEQVSHGDLHVASEMLTEYVTKFQATPTKLPKRPNEAPIEKWLFSVRKANLRAPSQGGSK